MPDYRFSVEFELDSENQTDYKTVMEWLKLSLAKAISDYKTENGIDDPGFTVKVYADDAERCPGCGRGPGEGPYEYCKDPDGCGYWEALHAHHTKP